MSKCCVWVSDSFFCVPAPSLVHKEMKIPGILFGLQVNSTKHLILEVIQGSNARPLLNESCVDLA